MIFESRLYGRKVILAFGFVVKARRLPTCATWGRGWIGQRWAYRAKVGQKGSGNGITVFQLPPGRVIGVRSERASLRNAAAPLGCREAMKVVDERRRKKSRSGGFANQISTIKQLEGVRMLLVGIPSLGNICSMAVLFR